VKNKIQKLITLLHHDKVKVELDATQLAEALWLAEYIELSQKNDEVRRASLWDRFKSLFEFNFDKKRAFKTGHTPKEEPLKPKETIVEIEEPSASLSLPKNDESTASEYLSTPKKRDIFVHNSLLKALLGLKQKSISNKKELFCEEDTVEYLAQTGVLKPFFKGKKERYFELFLIVDEHVSMEIWSETVATFEKKLNSFKIFSKITRLYLESSPQKALLYRDKAKRVKQDIRYFKNSNQRALTFVLSDTIGLAWRETTALTLIYEIQQNIPTVLIHMLPYRMWDGTILEHTNQTTLHSINAHTPNKNLISEVDRKLLKLDSAYFENNRVLKLPVINFNEQDFLAISDLIRGKKENHVSGIVVNLDTIKPKEPLSEEALSATKRVEAYYQNASQPAIILAQHMAVVKRLNISIMQIIQKIMLASSNQTHLAEFFLGGLLVKSNEGDFYEFIEGVDEILTQELGNLKIHETLYKISDEIAKEIGSTLDFKALLNLHSSGDETFDKNDKIFAFISPKTLKRLGGRYAKIANEITGRKRVKREDEVILDFTRLVTPTTKRFIMGSEDGDEDEKPVHEVIINYDFEIAQTPVTVGEFRVFVEETKYVTEAEKGDGAYVWDGENYDKKKDASWKNPYFEQSDDHPVICVSWNDAQAYITWLNEKTGETYRLPTEAEWEFSCRAGSTTKWHFGDDEKALEDYAWYDNKGGKCTKPVATKKPNQWGFYDMHGNVWEWCLDDFEDNYNNTPTDGSEHILEKKKYKSLRGGSWFGNAGSSRSSYRNRVNPTNRNYSVGFRLLRTLP